MTVDSRIAIFLPSLAGGGAQRVMLDVARCLAQAGNEVCVVVGVASGPYVDYDWKSVSLVDLGAERMSLAVWPLTRWLRVSRPGVLISTLAHANIVTFLSSRLSGIPIRLVLREANTPSRTASRSTKEAMVTWLARSAYRRADAVIAGSQGVADELTEVGVRSEILHVVENPINVEDIARNAIMDAGHPWLREENGPPVVLGAGRLVYQKGFDVLLDAFRIIRARRSVRLIILGEGEERETLLEHARNLGIAEDVDLPGFVSNPYAYMGRSDVFVLSSRWEGLPNVLIQALACGCPCVSADCPSGPAEILECGQYGELVPVEDSELLAAAIGRSLDKEVDPEFLRERARYYGSESLINKWRAVALGVNLERGITS